uniref:Uncharacterized protein n=1 Tax=Haemonchus placei TaxID=6290 RepID=A0A0N4W7Y8_HAEPC
MKLFVSNLRYSTRISQQAAKVEKSTSPTSPSSGAEQMERAA